MDITRPKSDFWFVCVDIAVIKDEKLSPRDKAIYMTFCAYADVKTRETPISVKTLADKTGCGIRTAQKSIKELIERGVLERKEQYKDGKQTESLYRLIGHDAPCYLIPDISEEPSPEKLTSGLNVPEVDGEPRGAIFAEAAENSASEGAKLAGYAENDVPGGAKPAGYAENDVLGSAKSAEYADTCTPLGAESEHRNLGEKCRKCLDFESWGKTSLEAQDTGETAKARRREFYGAILDAYHTILPELPKSETLTASGAVLIEARIGEDLKRENLEWWRRYFNRVREFQWPMGENDKGWRANFFWLLSAKGMEMVNSEHFRDTRTREAQLQRVWNGSGNTRIKEAPHPRTYKLRKQFNDGRENCNDTAEGGSNKTMRRIGGDGALV
jgi:hypothetical protein